VRTTVALTPAETRRLRWLRGQPLDSLWTDGWGVYLQSGTRTLAFLPGEEGIADVFHPDADVVRIRVEEQTGSHSKDGTSELCADLGRILRLARMTTAIASSPPWHVHPDDPSVDAPSRPPENRTLALVDVGVALEADGGWAVVATDGTGFRVFAALEGRAEERLACLTGKVLLAPIFSSPLGVPA
jgi:hypothetical protein